MKRIFMILVFSVILFGCKDNPTEIEQEPVRLTGNHFLKISAIIPNDAWQTDYRFVSDKNIPCAKITLNDSVLFFMDPYTIWKQNDTTHFRIVCSTGMVDSVKSVVVTAFWDDGIISLKLK